MVVWRQRAPLTLENLARVLANGNGLAFELYSASPLIEVAVASWLLSLRFERLSRREQRARTYATVGAFLAAAAISIWAAEEGLAAPILHLPGASTSVFAFAFLPTDGGMLLAAVFVVTWLLTHLIGRTLARR